MEKEIEDIIGYEGLYSININTIIYSKGRNGTRGGICRQWVNSRGYSVVYFSRNNIYKTLKVHRLMALTFIPNPNNYPQINHINGIKTDNRVENLEWCTSKDNIIHAHKMQLTRHKRGHEAISTKLSLEERTEIVRLYACKNKTQKDIAKIFNISQALISLVVKEFTRFSLIESSLAIDRKTLIKKEEK